MKLGVLDELKLEWEAKKGKSIEVHCQHAEHPQDRSWAATVLITHTSSSLAILPLLAHFASHDSCRQYKQSFYLWK